MASSPKARGIPAEVLQDAPDETQGAFSIVSNFMSDAGDAFDSLLGAANQNSLETDWYDVPAGRFENGWSNNGSPWVGLSYKRTSTGWVWVRGYVVGGTTTAGTSIFTLPEGFRPRDYESFAVDSNSAFGRVNVLNDGRITIVVGSATYLSLSGIGFQAAPKRRA